MSVITIKPKDVVIPFDLLFKLRQPKAAPKAEETKPQEEEKENDSSNS